MFSAQLSAASANQAGFAGGRAAGSTTCAPLVPTTPVSSQTALQKASMASVDHR